MQRGGCSLGGLDVDSCLEMQMGRWELPAGCVCRKSAFRTQSWCVEVDGPSPGGSALTGCSWLDSLVAFQCRRASEAAVPETLEIPAAKKLGGNASEAEHVAGPTGRFLVPGEGRFGQKGCTHALHPFQDQGHGWTRACRSHAVGQGRGCCLLKTSSGSSEPSAPGLLALVTDPCPTGGTGTHLCLSWLSTAPQLPPQNSARLFFGSRLRLVARIPDSIFRQKSTKLESSGEDLALLVLTKQVCLGSVPVGGCACGPGGPVVAKGPWLVALELAASTSKAGARDGNGHRLLGCGHRDTLLMQGWVIVAGRAMGWASAGGFWEPGKGLAVPGLS